MRESSYRERLYFRQYFGHWSLIHTIIVHHFYMKVTQTFLFVKGFIYAIKILHSAASIVRSNDEHDSSTAVIAEKEKDTRFSCNF